jgi:hypothetical protein
VVNSKPYPPTGAPTPFRYCLFGGLAGARPNTRSAASSTTWNGSKPSASILPAGICSTSPTGAGGGPSARCADGASRSMAARASAGRAGLSARGVKPVESGLGVRPLGTEPAAAPVSAAGSGGQAQMGEDPGDYGGFFNGAMIFKAPPQFGQRSISMSKTRLSRRAQLMRAGEQCA